MPREQYTIIVFILISSLFILMLISFIVFILFLYQRRHISYQKGLEQLKSDFDKTLLTTQLEIQEQTFQNISREIHDNIGLSLTLAKLNLNTIEWDDPRKWKEKIGGSISFISKAIEDLSYISKSLSTGFIEENGLLNALDLEIAKIQKLGILKMHHEVIGSPVYMRTQKELIIFRILQEVLNNCIKHAQATTFSVRMNYTNDYLEIELSDNGKGFDTKSSSSHVPGKGTGLLNIVKRASHINASCNVDSSPAKGTSVYLRIPY